MISVTHHDNRDEKEREAVAARAKTPASSTSPYSPASPKAEARDGSPSPGMTKSEEKPRLKSQRRPASPMARYLERVLEPADDAPQEEKPPVQTPPDPAPRPSEGRLRSRAASPLPDTAKHPEPREAPEAPRESRPAWHNADSEPPKTPVPAGVTRHTPPPRPTARSYVPKEKTGSARQKMMTVLIPVLAITLVAILKYPLGARPAATAASLPVAETVPPAVPGVEIAWAVPDPYEFQGRDPMRTTAPVVEDRETTVPATQTAAELLVVTGILHSEDRPAAIVNTQIVHEGQPIAGAIVEKIDTDGVQFVGNGRRWKQTVNR
jgi:hypothetical protein